MPPSRAINGRAPTPINQSRINSDNRPGRVNTKFDQYSNFVFLTCTANAVKQNCAGMTDEAQKKACIDEQQRTCYIQRPAAVVEGTMRSLAKEFIYYEAFPHLSHAIQEATYGPKR